MRKYNIITVCFIFSLLSVSVHGGVYENDDLMNTIIQKAGIIEDRQSAKEEMSSIVDFIYKNNLKEWFPVEKAHFEKYKVVIADYFYSDNLHEKYKKYISESLNRSEQKEVVDWLESPLGKKIIALESEKIPIIDVEKGFKEIFGKEEFRQRVKLFQKYNEALRITESHKSNYVNLKIAVIASFYAGCTKVRERSIPVLIRDIKKQDSSTIFKMLFESDFKDFMLKYKGLSIEELNQYFEFVESETGKKYTNAILRASNDIVLENSKRVYEELGLNRAKWKQIWEKNNKENRQS